MLTYRCVHNELNSLSTQMICRVPYTLEVMKGGQIVQQHSIADRAFYRFGRTPVNEVHPTWR